MEYRVNQGGLMRCCLASLDDYMHDVTTEPAVGATIGCKYEAEDKPTMVLDPSGVWRWVGVGN